MLPVASSDDVFEPFGFVPGWSVEGFESDAVVADCEPVPVDEVFGGRVSDPHRVAFACILTPLRCAVSVSDEPVFGVSVAVADP